MAASRWSSPRKQGPSVVRAKPLNSRFRGNDGAAFADVPAFVSRLAFADLPDEVIASARRSLLDLIGIAAGGSRAQAARIACTYAASELCGRTHHARVLFDGRRAGMAGAAFAGASTIDALDGHDGHVLTKGHAGAALLPALLALVDGMPGELAGLVDGREFLLCLTLGYEIATRAGIALHATVADYHCSGAWNALGCAAIAARRFGFEDVRTRHALGIAEYFGPRGQILRACNAPTMVKDGSGWGAHAGVTAALLAREGFTGAPAVSVERNDASRFWSDLGVLWRIREQYFKPYPVCRWAQPAIEAALALKRAHRFAAEQVTAIAVESFREAVTLGSQCPMPRTTEEAQYSLSFPVAAALVVGRVGAEEVDCDALSDPLIARLVGVTTAHDDADFSRRFPSERWARVSITLDDGRRLVSEPAEARGGPENPLSDEELKEKYRTLAEPVLGVQRTDRIEAAVEALDQDDVALPALLEELLEPIE